MKINYKIMNIKHYYKISIACLALLSVSCSENKPIDSEWPEITIESKPWTRWWWLGNDVNEQGLNYNLTQMSNAGIGGVEITPIYGVQERETHYIDYLSPEWMKMLAFTETKANELGMKVDMNNGTGWPFGGKHVTVEDAATKAIFQHYELKKGTNLQEKIEVNDPKQKDIALFCKLIAYTEKNEPIDLSNKVDSNGMLQWTATEETKLIALFIGKTRQQVKRAAPGGNGYVLNHFDKDAVNRYLSKFDDAFSQNNTPFPNSFFNDSYEVYGADWTPSLLTEFENRRGYKLENHFQDLLAKGEYDLSTRVICDYRETIGELLKENFTQVWTEWAHKHGTLTKNQAHGSPANLIDLYATVDIPECESFGISDFNIPTLRKDDIRKDNDGDPTTLKYASSAAHIAGKKYCSSETFTWLTEHFRTSLSQCKPEIDLMFTSGVNHVFFHGSTYSPEDAAWPGWKFYASVDMSPTNSIWTDAPAFFEYITRTQSFLQYGKPNNDFLYYLPLHDIWESEKNNHFTTFAIHGMRERLPDFCNGVETVMNLGYDLDYISDSFIETTCVKNGHLQTSGGAQYKALIIPAVKLIPLETLEKINQLVELGATVIFTDHYPIDVPGLANIDKRRDALSNELSKLPSVKSFHSATVNKFGKGTIITGENYAEILPLTNVKNEAFVSDFGGKLIRRSNETGYHYFMTMLDNRPINSWVEISVDAKSAMFFNPMTGEKGKAQLRRNNNHTEVYMQLKAGESIILKTFNTDVNVNSWNYIHDEKTILTLTDNWTLNFPTSQPNIDDEFKLDELVSWTLLNNDSLKVNMGTGRYCTSFEFNKQNNKQYLINLGDVRESAKISLNGKLISTLFAVPFETNITEHLINGTNELTIEVTNLPANRIADYDRRAVNWRIFNEINFVSITYKDTRFDSWETMPSGLLGPVTIKEASNIQF